VQGWLHGDGHAVGRSLPGRIAGLAAGRWGWVGDSRGGCDAKISARALVSTCGGVAHELCGKTPFDRCFINETMEVVNGS